jgi:hypothetical protein
MAKRNVVSVQLNRMFYNKIYEPARQKFSAQIGKQMSIPEFSKFLVHNNFQFNLKPRPIIPIGKISRRKLCSI